MVVLGFLNHQPYKQHFITHFPWRKNPVLVYISLTIAISHGLAKESLRWGRSHALHSLDTSLHGVRSFSRRFFPFSVWVYVSTSEVWSGWILCYSCEKNRFRTSYRWSISSQQLGIWLTQNWRFDADLQQFFIGLTQPKAAKNDHQRRRHLSTVFFQLKTRHLSAPPNFCHVYILQKKQRKKVPVIQKAVRISPIAGPSPSMITKCSLQEGWNVCTKVNKKRREKTLFGMKKSELSRKTFRVERWLMWFFLELIQRWEVWFW